LDLVFNRSCRHALSLHNIKRRKRAPDGGAGSGGPTPGGSQRRRSTYAAPSGDQAAAKGQDADGRCAALPPELKAEHPAPQCLYMQPLTSCKRHQALQSAVRLVFFDCIVCDPAAGG
jgi:hypothetical protein